MRNRFVGSLIVTLLLLSVAPGGAGAQIRVEATRGELLYTKHCVECHNARVHWREQRLASDWASLRAQVRRWQDLQKLGWSEADITEVARHLDTHYYNYPTPGR